MYNDFNRKEIERQREEMIESYANKKAEMLEKTEQVRYIFLKLIPKQVYVTFMPTVHKRN